MAIHTYPRAPEEHFWGPWIEPTNPTQKRFRLCNHWYCFKYDVETGVAMDHAYPVDPEQHMWGPWKQKDARKQYRVCVVSECHEFQEKDL